MFVKFNCVRIVILHGNELYHGWSKGTYFFNSLKPSGYYMYHQVQHSAILLSAHTLYLCVLCGYQNKQRLFHCTALTDWFLGFIYEVKQKNALYWNHVRPCACHLVWGTEQCVGFHEIRYRRSLKNVNQAWISWKSAPWQSHFTYSHIQHQYSCPHFTYSHIQQQYNTAAQHTIHLGHIQHQYSCPHFT
jgi:hypothetical protein